MDKRVLIKGMTCAHCAMSVQEALAAIEGVTSAEVDLQKGAAIVRSESVIPDATLSDAVAGAGYTVVTVEDQ